MARPDMTMTNIRPDLAMLGIDNVDVQYGPRLPYAFEETDRFSIPSALPLTAWINGRRFDHDEALAVLAVLFANPLDDAEHRRFQRRLEYRLDCEDVDVRGPGPQL